MKKKSKTKLTKEFIRENLIRDRNDVIQEAMVKFDVTKSTVITLITLVNREIKEELEELKLDLEEKLKFTPRVINRQKFIFDDSKLWGVTIDE